MNRRHTPGQMDFLETTTGPPSLVETVARYRVTLVKEEDTPYGDLSMNHPSHVAGFLRQILDARPQEHMIGIYLDTHNRLIGWTIAHIGTLNRAAVEPRTIFQIALSLNTASLILLFRSRNKRQRSRRLSRLVSPPSAQCSTWWASQCRTLQPGKRQPPSRWFKARRMAQAGDLIGIHLLDHIIVGHDRTWTSLRERGGW